MTSFKQLYQFKEQAENYMRNIHTNGFSEIKGLDLTDSKLFEPLTDSSAFDSKLYKNKTELADAVLKALPKDPNTEKNI